MTNFYKDIWASLIKSDFFPSYLKGIQVFEFEKFKDIIHGMNKESNDLVNATFGGNALIIKNVVKKNILSELKEKIYNLEKNEEEKNLQMLEGCANFHVSNKNKLAPIQDNYDETAHSHFFFRWNRDNLKIFDHLNPIWELIKMFSGLNKNEYKKNTPKDSIIDRIQVIRYPLNEGYITTHCDVSAWQKLNIGICLNENGKDFNSGGLYLLNEDEKKINVEEKLEIGDCFCWVPTIFHGVDIPRKNGVDKTNWNSNTGRWQALALTIQSHCVKNRILSTGYNKFKKDPMKYKKLYRDAFNL